MLKVDKTLVINEIYAWIKLKQIPFVSFCFFVSFSSLRFEPFNYTKPFHVHITNLCIYLSEMSMYEGDKFKDGSVQGNEYSSFTSNVISVHGRQGTRNLTLVGRSIRPVGNVQSNLEGSVKS